MKRNDIVIIVVVLLFVVGAVILIGGLNRKPSYDWSPTYMPGSEEPYGTSIIYGLLEDYFPDHGMEVITRDLETTLQEAKGTHSNYLFIGEFPYYTDSTFDILANYVARGNDAMIITTEIPEVLTDKLFNGTYYLNDTIWYLNPDGDSVFFIDNKPKPDINSLGAYESSGITLNYLSGDFRTQNGYRYTYYVMDKIAGFSWGYFLPEFAEHNTSIEKLGSIGTPDLSNFIRIPYGEGYFYLHTTPLAFTNFFAIEEDKIEYINKAFSYLKPGELLWDDFSRSYVEQFNNDQQEEGPLRFILSEPALRAAWYTLLAGLLLFLVFRSKRSQKPIPVLEKNENRSLDFVQTIGRMYFMKRNHAQLAHQKMKLFLHFIQERYQIPTAETDAAFMEKVQLKSEVSLSSITEIFKHYTYIQNTHEVTEHDLIQLHQLIETFYKHCK